MLSENMVVWAIRPVAIRIPSTKVNFFTMFPPFATYTANFVPKPQPSKNYVKSRILKRKGKIGVKNLNSLKKR
jgi:hypothetical protein